MGFWLVLISLSAPQAPPTLVQRFANAGDCYQAAVSGNNSHIMPLYRQAVPKGKGYLCMRFVYPT